MRILLSSYTLDLSGVPTYTHTLVPELVRQGHVCLVYSPHGGRLEKALPTVRTLDGSWTPDVILAQHTPCAVELRRVYPRVPMVYVSHGVTPDIDQPPRQLSIQRWVAVNEQVSDYLRQRGVTGPIDIIRDCINLQKFHSRRPLRERPHVLFISNYKKWRNYKWLADACQALDLPFHAVGAPYRRSRHLVRDINAADLVVSWGRGVLEAMACGRAVVSFDKEWGDGYLTPDTYLVSRQRNFSHFLDDDGARHFTRRGLRKELLQYSPLDGPVNRQIVETHHDVVPIATSLVRCLSTAVSETVYSV